MADEKSNPQITNKIAIESLKTPKELLEDIKLSDLSDRLAGAESPFQKMNEHLKSIESLTRASSMMNSIDEQIANQRKLLDSFSKPTFPNLKLETPQAFPTEITAPSPLKIPELPRNPILDTNKKLTEIGEQFEKMLDVMVNAATIATTIQSNAANFIEKFEDASAKTDESAKKAIRVGVIAIGIAVLTPFIPMIIEHFSPNKMVPAIEALTREVITARQVQDNANERLLQELRESDDQSVMKIVKELRQGQTESAEILREILRALKAGG